MYIKRELDEERLEDVYECLTPFRRSFVKPDSIIDGENIVALFQWQINSKFFKVDGYRDNPPVYLKYDLDNKTVTRVTDRDIADDFNAVVVDICDAIVNAYYQWLAEGEGDLGKFTEHQIEKKTEERCRMLEPILEGKYTEQVVFWVKELAIPLRIEDINYKGAEEREFKRRQQRQSEYKTWLRKKIESECDVQEETQE